MPTSVISSWMAVSGVIAVLPLTISLIVLIGRPIRRARSDCDMPRSCIASSRISPGATAQFRCHVACSAAMVVHHLGDQDLGHERLVVAAVWKRRDGVVVGDEHQPIGATQVEREFAGAVYRELMTIPGHICKRRQRRRRLERDDAPPKDLPLVSPKPALAGLGRSIVSA